MSHGRKPRKPRWLLTPDTLQLAAGRAAKLPASELSEILSPLALAFTKLREGVATEMDWATVCSAVNVSKAIERQGVVRGLAEHFTAAETALQEVQRRAMATGAWSPTALYYQELDNLREAVDLHAFQLRQLSRNEALRALRLAEAEVRSSGGRAIAVPALQGQLLPA